MNKTSSKTPFSLYRLASGKPGKKYRKKEFLEIASSGKEFKTSKVTYSLQDGYVYHGSSKEEVRLIKKLERLNAFASLRGQCIGIPYTYGGKRHTYYPDFLVLTKTGRILIIEVKQVADMSSRLNQKKYKALASYCKKHGYLYLMCDRKLHPYKELVTKKRHGRVEMAIEAALKEKGRFTKDDLFALFEGKSTRQKEEVRARVATYVAAYQDEVRMAGDTRREVGRFSIKFKKGKCESWTKK